MPNSTIEPLILDLLEWLAGDEHTYAEVLDAWHTSCPRLTVWEDANDRGLVETNPSGERNLVRPSALGARRLAEASRANR